MIFREESVAFVRSIVCAPAESCWDIEADVSVESSGLPCLTAQIQLLDESFESREPPGQCRQLSHRILAVIYPLLMPLLSSIEK